MAKKKTAKRTHKEVKPTSPKQFHFPCQSFKQGNTELAIFACSGKRLWSVVQINQRSEDKDEGYQRVLSPSRVNKIARFIDEKGNIPLSVLISFSHARISAGEVIIQNRPDAGWVIDGQHRLAGISKATSDLILPVVAVFNLSEMDQIQHFVTINKEQKGVPAALYLDLLAKMPGTKAEKDLRDERAVELANMCRTDETSPFYNRIVVTLSPKVGQLSLTNWTRKVAPLIDPKTGVLHILPDENRAMAINNLYRALSIVFPKEYERYDSIFFKTIGFGAFMNVFRLIWDITIQHYGNFRTADIVKTLKGIEGFDPGTWRQIGTGNKAETFAGEDIRSQLMDNEIPSGNRAIEF